MINSEALLLLFFFFFFCCKMMQHSRDCTYVQVHIKLYLFVTPGLRGSKHSALCNSFPMMDPLERAASRESNVSCIWQAARALCLDQLEGDVFGVAFS